MITGTTQRIVLGAVAALTLSTPSIMAWDTQRWMRCDLCPVETYFAIPKFRYTQTEVIQKNCNKGPVQRACIDDSKCSGYRIDSKKNKCFLYYFHPGSSPEKNITMSCNRGRSNVLYGAMKEDAVKDFLTIGQVCRKNY